MSWKNFVLALLLAALGCIFAGCGGGGESNNPPTVPTGNLKLNVYSRYGSSLTAAPHLKAILFNGPYNEVICVSPVLNQGDGKLGSATIYLSQGPQRQHTKMLDFYSVWFFIDTDNDDQVDNTESSESWEVKDSDGTYHHQCLYYDPIGSANPGWNIYRIEGVTEYFIKPAYGAFSTSALSMY